MTPDFSKAEKKKISRLLGFPPLLSRGDFSPSVSARHSHLSCPRNRHSRLSLVSSARRVSRRGLRERQPRVRENNACERRYPGSGSSRGDVRIIRRAARRISPEKLAAKLRLLSPAIAHPGFLAFVFRTYPRTYLPAHLPAAYIGVLFN